MSKLKELIKNNKFFRYIYIKWKSFLAFFHIPTILGHDKLEVEKDVNQSPETTQKDTTDNKSKVVQKIESGFKSIITNFDNKYDQFSDNNQRHELEYLAIKESRDPLKVGLYIILIFFGFFFSWMVFAKIDGSVVAQGQVVFAQNKQNVQHQTGGTIKSILVKEGDIVHYGQTLLTLHDSDIRAGYNTSYNKLFTLKANKARLISERDGSVKIKFPQDILNTAKESFEFQDIIKSQERSFLVNTGLLKTHLQVIEDKKNQFKSDINSLELQQSLLLKRIQYTEEQIKNTEKLLLEGNASKVRLFELKSQRDSLMQENQRFNGMITNYHGQITALEEDLLITKNNKLKEIEDSLKGMEIEINSEQERIAALDESLKKNVIKAPIDGVINNLKYRNAGEVVQPSATIMEIVPQNDFLIIEAKLANKEINSLLNTGMDFFSYNHQDINNLLDAKINLVSYSSRRYKKLKGSVFYVGTDVVIDPRIGAAYYPLKVMISKKELEYAAKKNMKLFPGMPAEVYILTESRTPLSYIISPITASLDKAFIDE
jgi:HlyD family secretion protein